MKELKSQLPAVLRQRNRDTDQKRQRQRKRTEPPKIAQALVAWDMKRTGSSYRQIVEALWSDDVERLKQQGKHLRLAGERGTLLDRVKEHVKYAEKRIQSAFSLKKETQP